jgi:hypothetical protein
VLAAFHAPSGDAFEFLVLFAVILLGPIVVARFGLPGLIGLVLGGFAIGAHGLDLIHSGNQTVPALGQLGLLYLMFVAGLELDLHSLRSTGGPRSSSASSRSSSRSPPGSASVGASAGRSRRCACSGRCSRRTR